MPSPPRTPTNGTGNPHDHPTPHRHLRHRPPPPSTRSPPTTPASPKPAAPPTRRPDERQRRLRRDRAGHHRAHRLDRVARLPQRLRHHRRARVRRGDPPMTDHETAYLDGRAAVEVGGYAFDAADRIAQLPDTRVQLGTTFRPPSAAADEPTGSGEGKDT